MRLSLIMSTILIYNVCTAQYNRQLVKYNADKDTLILINTKLIDRNKISLCRDSLFYCDSLRTNINSLSVASFTLASFTLGKSFELHSTSSLITPQMKTVIKGGQQKYKFVYLKNIVLFNKFGKTCNPAYNVVKISFID